MNTRQRFFDIAAAGTLGTALLVALAVPPEQTQGDLARMLFIHVPAAWLAYVAFGVTMFASAAYLLRGDFKWDRLAAASAEVGVYFTGLAIALGMIWGKPTWGVWWTWDARLVLTAVLFFVYVGYLALRRAIVDPGLRARRAAVMGILAIVQIPVVHFSVIWWRTLHQPPSLLRPDSLQLDPPFRAAVVMALVAFSLVYVALVMRRIQLAALEAEVEAAVGELPVAGTTITAPVLEDGRV
ncbi:MAG: cytochrome c biogenesis protein CcsA [Acidimicrobiia bacterium]